MKTTKFFLALFAALFFAVGTTSAYTITFKVGSDDGTKASGTTACSAVVSDGADYLSGNLVEVSNVWYAGKAGLKLGTSSGAGKIKMTLAEKATPLSVVVRAKLYNASKSATLKVNGSEAQTMKADFDNFTFDITKEIEYIQLEGTKYCWIESVSINTCDNPATITKGAEENGTFKLSKKVVCGDDAEGEEVLVTDIEPAEGYRFKEIVSTKGTVDNENKKVTGLKEDATITVVFEAIPERKVTWNVNGDESLKTNVKEGSKPVFPSTPSACDATSNRFLGWATAAWPGKVSNLDGKTVYIKEEEMPAVAGDVTYYAVFANIEGVIGKVFDWEGGASADLKDLEEVTLSGEGTDYNPSSHGKYITKLDETGDYIMITTSAAIGTVSVGVKMIGGSNSSSFTVQEATATDAEFSDVETLEISGSQNDILSLVSTKAFKADSRVVKLLFKKGSNIGVGPIAIEGAYTFTDALTTCTAADQCQVPSFSVPAGTYNESVSVQLSSATDGAEIYYTLDGTTPSKSSTKYTAAIEISEAKTIKAIAVKDGLKDSEVNTASYTFKPALPTISGEKLFMTNTTVTLACATDGAVVYYTTDGSAPTSTSTKYTAPFTLDASATVKAIATKTGWTDSEVAEQEFSKIEVMTVTEAIAAIDAAGSAEIPGQYVEGMICQIDSYNESYKSITYWISVDGSTTTKLKVFGGLGIDGAKFDAKTDLSEGDKVIVKGDLKKYNGDYQFNKDNQLVSRVAAEVVSLAISGTPDKVKYGEGELFDPKGLVATATCNTGYKKVISEGLEWLNDLTDGKVIVAGTVKVTVKLGAIVSPAYDVDVTITEQTPVLSLKEGTYTTAQTLTITAASGAKIYYTTDGTDPTNASTEYTAPIELNARGTYTFKVIAISAKGESFIVSATFVLNLPFASLEELIEAWPDKGTTVIVSFENKTITKTTKTVRKGIFLDVLDKYGHEIEIYYSNEEFPESWELNGTLSGTLEGTWTSNGSGENTVWEIIPSVAGWKWTDLTYKAPESTALDNTALDTKAVKMIENGRIIIIKDGVKYNVLGTIINK